MEKVVTDIGPVERTADVTYLAFTRVKSLQGIAFRPPFDLPRLQKLGKSTVEVRAYLVMRFQTMKFDHSINSTTALCLNPRDQVTWLDSSFTSLLTLEGKLETIAAATKTQAFTHEFSR